VTSIGKKRHEYLGQIGKDGRTILKLILKYRITWQYSLYRYIQGDVQRKLCDEAGSKPEPVPILLRKFLHVRLALPHTVRSGQAVSTYIPKELFN